MSILLYILVAVAIVALLIIGYRAVSRSRGDWGDQQRGK